MRRGQVSTALLVAPMLLLAICTAGCSNSGSSASALEAEQAKQTPAPLAQRQSEAQDELQKKNVPQQGQAAYLSAMQGPDYLRNKK
jgi:hypothetical protein